ncbi:MAG TPA: Gfo/Idh/MocA family oxidoreductase [Vicinamibacterales bacterium]|nr:Gfo/Idh/MocA family oxidoreductase [Vicinamibacterales bacterium]
MAHLGILGAGNISATHARAAAGIPGVSVAAVWGENQQKAEQIARAHRATPYGALDAFLTHRPMDIVAIGSPSGLHAEHARAAVRQGLHVLVEKPLDISVARIDPLLSEVDRAGVKLAVFFQDRLKPDLLRAKQLIDENRLGPIVLASARVKWYRPPEYYTSSRWRGTWQLDGGGALMNQGIHTVDALLWLLGPIASVQAASATLVHDIEVEDTAAAVLRFASGALGVLEAATSIFPGYPRRLEITGQEGTVIVNGDRLMAIQLREVTEQSAEGDCTSHSSAVTPVVADATAHQRILEDFIESVRTGREPACNGREARKSVAVVEAIYESSRTRRMIEVDYSL